ncbi:hypothetical protein C2857_002755 [Epichloe festucae Fl1]|uniref:Uncharacterized protein n=1 Tax=Epichloe festucae (strain Fl1) TaxID=877507 RepID=A0A7U3SN22_EPIFF|nr:hypothetical protein C2857_002755 [Epichloe festucae Fl1]
MIPARVIVALAGLASAFQGASFFEAAPANSLPGLSIDDSIFEGLSARAEQCLAGQATCGTSFCMPEGGTCCDGVQGTYCNPGDYCLAQGCCPHGKVCEGSPSGGCPAGKRQCGTVCIPDTSACCSSDRWCDSPMACGKDGMCVGPSTPSRAITTPGPASSTSSHAAASAARSATQMDSSPAASSTSPGVTATASATRSATRTDSSPAASSTSPGVTASASASATRSPSRTDSSPAKGTGDDAGRGGDDGNGNGDVDGDINRGGNGSTQDEKKTPVGVIVGSVVGGLAGLALAGLGITLLLRHNNNKKQEDAVPTQTFQQQPPPPPPPPTQQRRQPSPHYTPGASSSPARGTGSPPRRVYTAYSPSMAAAMAMASSPTATYYSTDARTGAPSLSPILPAPAPAPPPPPPAPGHLGAQQGGLHEMSDDDHRGQIHELA